MARKLFAVVVALVVVLFAILYEPDTFEPGSIRGKRVLVTGSSMGIGESIAYHYCSLGASVIITARREDRLQEVASKCKELGAVKVEYVVADMGLEDDRTRLIRETEKHLGGLDHLILNHALLALHLWTGSAKNMTSLQETMTVNFLSYVDLASKSHKMLAASNGSIGVISSVGGKISMAFMHSYSASKHALHGFFNGYREELKLRKIGVSITLCVLGAIENERTYILYKTRFPKFEPPVYFYLPSVNDTSFEIIKAVTTRTYELVYPLLAKLQLSLHRIMPYVVERDLSQFLFDSM